MPEKPQTGAKLFLGIMHLVGGLICILVPALSLKKRSDISLIVLGITLVMLGTSYVWLATESRRQKKKEEQKNNDIKEQNI
jgi:uncharacterized membrane protein HdeD (DUF308 family)